MKLAKSIVIVFGGLALCLVLMASAAVWWNNRTVAAPDRQLLGASLERGIAWLDGHGDELLQDGNAMLWWMVREAGRHTGDQRLARLFSRYDTQYLRPGNVWTHLFDEGSSEPLRYVDVARLPYYNQYFLYALTCDRLLGAEPLIQRQSEPDFCDHGRYRFMPACVTHQLMGLQMLERRRCGDQAGVRAAIARLQEKIERQLTWDVRVVDVYIQRVLMLVDSGAAERIKPIWLQRILDAQLNDGGWSGTRPILRLGLSTPLCFTQSGIAFTVPRSTFHATAQGVLLTSLLLENGE